MILHPAPDCRKAFGEGQHVMVLRAFAHLAEAGVITVLLAPSGIAPRRLDVAAGLRADPDFSPGRRYREGFDTLKCGFVLDPFPVIALVPETLA